MGSNLSSISAKGLKKEFDCTCKFRYRQKDINSHVKILDDGRVEITYDKTKAVTPGQAAVFYDGDVCLGSCIIDKFIMEKKVKSIKNRRTNLRFFTLCSKIFLKF
ncbi:MAG: aminomethyltransferase beta-barrel domain-containing protein [Anaerococcus obesiensis]